MKLLKGSDTVTLNDGVGQIVSAHLLDEDFRRHHIMMMGESALLRVIRDHPKTEDVFGRPMYAAFEQVGPDKCIFTIFPAAEKDYELKIRYYPHMKES